jgi:hypothetical protein
MRELFAAPRLTASLRTLLSITAVVVLVFGVFALLKIGSGGKDEAAKELITGSIQKSPAVRKPASDDAMASFFAAAAFQPAPQSMRSAAVARGLVPLPRPRPNR